MDRLRRNESQTVGKPADAHEHQNHDYDEDHPYLLASEAGISGPCLYPGILLSRAKETQLPRHLLIGHAAIVSWLK